VNDLLAGGECISMATFTTMMKASPSDRVQGVSSTRRTEMRWFGPESWDAPVNERCERAPIPVGETCISCKNLVEPNDDGFLVPFFNGITSKEEPWHYRCFMGNILGPDYNEDIYER
jgi:hypothetical protein